VVAGPAVGFSSILQSCGKVTRRQPESSYTGLAASVYAPVGSVTPAVFTSAKRHPASKSNVPLS
jgi:hypothetical protein